MTATQTMTLADFANARQNVVLFWASVGTPTGDYAPIGDPDFDFVERRNLLDLEGETDGSEWRWNGDGEPTDDRANTITKLHAYVDAKRWALLASE